MPATIRPATPDDLPTIVEFNRLLAKESEGIELDSSTLLEGVQTLLRNPSKGIYYVAEENGRVIGQMMITREWSDWRNGEYWWIQSVYVTKEQRGTGVFRSLFRHVQKNAIENGTVRAIRLYTDRMNHSAQKAYDKVGMHESGYKMFEMKVIDSPPR